MRNAHAGLQNFAKSTMFAWVQMEISELERVC
jgi:hypothetical protein